MIYYTQGTTLNRPVLIPFLIVGYLRPLFPPVLFRLHSYSITFWQTEMEVLFRSKWVDCSHFAVAEWEVVIFLLRLQRSSPELSIKFQWLILYNRFSEREGREPEDVFSDIFWKSFLTSRQDLVNWSTSQHSLLRIYFK